MRAFATFVLVLLFMRALPGCTGGASAPLSARADLLRVDSAMSVHSAVIEAKEAALRSLRELDRGLGPHAKYNLYDRLYSEYMSYDFDSAAYYAAKKRDVARALGNVRDAAVSSVHKARADLARGNDLELARAVAEAERDTSDRHVMTAYVDFMAAKAEAEGVSADAYRSFLRTAYDSLSVGWLYNECGYLREKGRFREAISLIDTNRERLSADRRGRAISNYIEGRLALALGDTVAAIGNLARSSVDDILTPVRDYSSLYELASLLFATGDIERAHRYINFAAEDHYASKVSSNITAANRLIPAISKAYATLSMQRNHRQNMLLTGIAVLAVLLAGALVWVVSAYRMAAVNAAEKTRLNEHLLEASERMRSLNAALSESNRTKDAYIVQYLSLCSYYIECVERYRNSLRATARNKGVNELMYQLNSATTVDRELKEFYTGFDSTFLKLFPDFVERFNELLVPEKRLERRPGEMLGTELRVFALIRLGITDSEKIAVFLRRSVSTVYNYRVKMRNASRFPRKDFDGMVAEIGMESFSEQLLKSSDDNGVVS